MDLLPVKWIFQRVPVEVDRNDNNCPLATLRVAVPEMVVVEFAANFNVSALLTDLVKLLNVVSPERIWLVPFNTTVPPPAAKVPLLMKLPENVVVPLLAVMLPLLVSLPLTVMLPHPPQKKPTLSMAGVVTLPPGA